MLSDKLFKLFKSNNTDEEKNRTQNHNKTLECNKQYLNRGLSSADTVADSQSPNLALKMSDIRSSSAVTLLLNVVAMGLIVKCASY